MTDRENVIKGLEKLREYADSEVHPILSPNNWGIYSELRTLIDEAEYEILDLLKEQEPRKPHYTTLRYLVNGTEVTVRHPECPRCIENGLVLWDAEIEKGQAYCKRCGQVVKWE